VTAQVGEDRSVLADVQVVEGVRGRNTVHGVWGWDEPPALPVAVPDPAPLPSSFFPPAGGVRVCVVEFPPGAGVAASPEAVGPDQLEAFRRGHDAVPPGGVRDEATGMHRTDTIDIGFVLEGEIDLEQADGSEITLRAGDVLVQNAALHAWRNRSGAPCAIGLVLVGVAGA
jgi:hypothetical protein